MPHLDGAVLAPRLLLAFDTDAALERSLEACGRIAVVAVLGIVAAWLLGRLITPAVGVAIRREMAGQPEVEVERRIDTLSAVIRHTIVAVIGIIGVITILPEFGINAGPLIAGLGLVGLAVGFGAQGIVRDVINGLEILIENQYGRGDFVKLGAVSGVVEDMNLRRTVLRDFDGTLHFVSHGLIDVASNHTRGYSRVRISVVLANSTDLDRVFKLIDEAGQALAADPEFATRIRQAPRATGVDRLGETSLDVSVESVTEPGEQWVVAGEFRRRLKQAMDDEGIRSEATATKPATPGAPATDGRV